MNAARDPSKGGKKDRDQEGDGRLAGAVNRLERALEDAVDAGDAATGVAAAYVDAAAARLKADARRRTARRSRRGESSGEPARHRGEDGDWWDGERPAWPSFGSRELRRDPVRGKIGGVCAGFANYFGVEAWVVRCIAVTGLIFLPQIVFPAYWIAFFVMDRADVPRARKPRPRAPSRPRARPRPDAGSRRHQRPEREPEPVDLAIDDVDADPALARETAWGVSPRRRLRHVHAEFDQVELRLRRMETHITSGQYELQRELAQIARSDP